MSQSSPSNDGDDFIGKTIAGRYRIISKLGEGGMGVTYRAWDSRDGIPVVVKIPRREIHSNPEFMGRFSREVKTMFGLSHKHIVPITDHGEEDGYPFVVMRFLPGGSLSNRRLRDASRKPKPMQPASLHSWLPQIAAALDFVHASGVVHRDVKPANIFFDASWGAFLGDFGVAKIVENSETFDKELTLTATHMGIGTQEYMPPEQFTPKAVIDGRADQYALAVMVYEMLAGVRPFAGESAHLIVEVTTRPVPPLQAKRSDLPASLVSSVHRALAKNPRERFANCQDFAAAVLQDVPRPEAEPDVARLLCPMCSKILKLPTSKAGKKGKCPNCSNELIIAQDLGALWLLNEDPAQVSSDGGNSESRVDIGALEDFRPISDTTPKRKVARVTKRKILPIAISGGLAAIVLAVLVGWNLFSAGKSKDVKAVFEAAKEKTAQPIPEPLPIVHEPRRAPMFLADMPVKRSMVGWDQLRVGNVPDLKINGNTYDKVVKADASSLVAFDLPDGFVGTLQGRVAVAGLSKEIPRPSRCRFRVLGNDTVLWESGEIIQDKNTGLSVIEEYDVPLKHVQTVTLEVDSLGANTCDWSVWINPVLVWEGSESIEAATQQTGVTKDNSEPQSERAWPADATVSAETGHAYKVVRGSVSWLDAKKRCEQMGGHLVTISSAEEQAIVLECIRRSGIQVDRRDGQPTAWDDKLWAGGTDEGTEGKWRWIDGSDWTFSNWTLNQPGIDGNFLNICPHIGGEWNDEGFAGEPPPPRIAGFICEWEPRTKTTAVDRKATVGKDDSGQNRSMKYPDDGVELSFDLRQALRLQLDPGVVPLRQNNVDAQSLMQVVTRANSDAQPDPGTLSSFRDAIGKTITFAVTGEAISGNVWGSNPYTADSILARAVVHCGVLTPGEAGIVSVTVQPGLQSYVGSTRNGVTTARWGAYGLSYQVEKGVQTRKQGTLGTSKAPGSGLSEKLKLTKPLDTNPLARFDFEGNAKNSGTGAATVDLKNTRYLNGALYLNGTYEYGKNEGYRAKFGVPELNYSRFTVLVRLKPKLSADRNVMVVGGKGYRWLGLESSRNGQLSLTLNNGRKIFNVKGVQIKADEWVTIGCSFNGDDKTVLVCVNGRQPVSFQLDKAFRFEVEDAGSVKEQSDKLWTFTNYSNGTACEGLIDELVVYGEALTRKELLQAPVMLK